MSYVVELGREADRNLVELRSQDIVNASVKLTHSQLVDWTIETKYDADFTTFAEIFAPMRLYWEDPSTGDREVLFHGQVVRHRRQNTGPGEHATSIIEGHDRGFTHLRRSAPIEIEDYSGYTAQQAIEHYWTIHTPFDATVEPQPLDNLPPIDAMELTDDHLTNLQKLHDRANFVFSVDHAAPGLEVHSMARGQVKRNSSWELAGRGESEAMSVEYDDDRRSYANIVVALGSHDEDQGGRLRWDAVNANEVQRLRDAGCPPGKSCAVAMVTDPNAGTLGEVRTMAETELSKRVEARKTQGTISVIPTWVQPGYAYDVDALGEDELVLEDINFDFGGTNETAKLDFVDHFGYAQDVATLRGQISRIVDTI